MMDPRERSFSGLIVNAFVGWWWRDPSRLRNPLLRIREAAGHSRSELRSIGAGDVNSTVTTLVVGGGYEQHG